MYIISNPKNQDAYDRNIFKKSCNKLSNEIKKILIEKANHVNPFNLKDLHKTISLDKLNSYRLACFEEINNIPNLKRLIYQTVYPHILNLLGFDLAIQKNLNLSIQFPGDQSSILNKHQDFVSGDSPFQKVIWIPITNAFSSNALHMTNKDNSYTPIKVSENEFLIFDPNTVHGNIVNETNQTRISLNIRVKNWFAPDSGENVPDRQFGIYYEDFCFSKSTLRAFEIIKSRGE